MKVDEKYFERSMHNSSIDDVVLSDEKILLRTKPNRKSYVLAAIIKMLPIALIWAAFDGTFLGLLFGGVIEVPKTLIPVIVVFFLIHLAPVWVWIINIVKASIEIKNIEYAFTDKRIIVRSGVIVDVKVVSYDSIVAVKAKVGLIDRLCKVGDIYVTANTQTVIIYDQVDPYGLASKLQRLAEDVKTDIRYPNAMRPAENPGYTTAYEGSAMSAFDEAASSDGQPEKAGTKPANDGDFDMPSLPDVPSPPEVPTDDGGKF